MPPRAAYAEDRRFRPLPDRCGRAVLRVGGRARRRLVGRGPRRYARAPFRLRRWRGRARLGGRGRAARGHRRCRGPAASGLILLVSRAGRSGGEESEGLLLRIYTPMLRWSLRHRLVVLLLALLAFGGGLGLVRFLPVTFFPPSEERLLIADVELPAGTALEKTSDKLRPFEDFLQQDEAIKSYQVSIGGEDTTDPESPVRPGNRAQAFINVKESADVRQDVGPGGPGRRRPLRGELPDPDPAERPAAGRPGGRPHRRLEAGARRGGGYRDGEVPQARRREQRGERPLRRKPGGRGESRPGEGGQGWALAGAGLDLARLAPRRQHRDHARGHAGRRRRARRLRGFAGRGAGACPSGAAPPWTTSPRSARWTLRRPSAASTGSGRSR